MRSIPLCILARQRRQRSATRQQVNAASAGWATAQVARRAADTAAQHSICCVAKATAATRDRGSKRRLACSALDAINQAAAPLAQCATQRTPRSACAALVAVHAGAVGARAAWWRGCLQSCAAQTAEAEMGEQQQQQQQPDEEECAQQASAGRGVLGDRAEQGTAALQSSHG